LNVVPAAEAVNEIGLPAQSGVFALTDGAVGVVTAVTVTVTGIAGQLEAVSCIKTVCVPIPAAVELVVGPVLQVYVYGGAPPDTVAVKATVGEPPEQITASVGVTAVVNPGTV
jgi:hypothetical protein